MFGLNKPTFLGIDFGTSSIKAVELSLSENRIKLENYGEISLADIEKGIGEGQGSYDDRIVVYLQALLKRLEPKSKEAYVAMPAFIGLVALVEFPKMKEAELEEAIKFEAHKYIPSPLDEVALSWEVVGESTAPVGDAGTPAATKTEILLVAALNKEVQRYEGYVKAVGYEMQLLELETFSLVRALINGDSSTLLVIDIGSRATNLVLVEDGLVKVSRNLDVGGRDITRTLTEGLNIAQDRAESLKKSEKDYLNSAESKLIFPALEAIGAEMERIRNVFQNKHAGKDIDGIILSGGTASLTGLASYFEKQVNLPVRVGNPWEHIEYRPELEAAVKRMGTSFSVALGLALQGVMRSMKKKK